jgi:bifunctional non-homologous end joining protein LigD
MALEEYRAKRNFERTPEPSGGGPGAARGMFVVQKHAARRLHYDFRLELDGVLKSWAVTRGPSLNPHDKRLAVRVEDHPLDYGGFEGVIPKGQYGGGTVMVWDTGRWEPVGPADEGLAKGVLKFRLDGRKLKGAWALVQMKRDPKNWLLIKEQDGEARPGADLLAEQPLSVRSGRSLEQIAAESAGGVPVAEIKGAKPAPMPECVEPQLCTLVAAAPEGGDWLHEIKYDGYRVLCRIDGGTARLLTRGGLDWTDKFAAVARALASLPCRQALLDAEVVVLNASGASDFSALQEALSAGRDRDMALFAFDLLYLDGYDLTAATLEERKAALARLLEGAPPPLRYSDHVAGRGPEFAAKACSFALEGVVSKRRDRPYRPGRGGDWLKAKCTARQEFVIAGYTPPSSGRAGFGALLLGYWQDGVLRYAGKVGTGFSQRTQEAVLGKLVPLQRPTSPLADPPKDSVTWVEPQLVAEVEFSEWTPGGHLRHPSFQGLREDKAAADVVREATPGDSRRDTGVEAKLQGFAFTHPDRVLWPGQGVTKKGLAAYYADVAPFMLPHVAGRPLSLVRCPEGEGADCFFQRHALAGLGDGVKTVPVPGEEPTLWIDGVEGLFALVQVGVLEIHNWGSRVDHIERPDRLCFDLDPDPDLPWSRVVEAARQVRGRLEKLGLRSFLKTTGGKGLHLVVPIVPDSDWTAAKAFCKSFAATLARDHPDRYVATITKARRTGKILIDYLRNQFSATWVAPYSTRARPGAPLSVPLTWDELDEGLRSDHFTLATIGRRLGALGRDPWDGIGDTRQRLLPLP